MSSVDQCKRAPLHNHGRIQWMDTMDGYTMDGYNVKPWLQHMIMVVGIVPAQYSSQCRPSAAAGMWCIMYAEKSEIPLPEEAGAGR